MIRCSFVTGQIPIESVGLDRLTNVYRYTGISEGRAMLWQLKRTRAQSHPRLLRCVDSQSSMAARIKRFSRDPVELAAQLQELPASEVKTAYSCTRRFSVGSEPRFR